MTTETEQSRDDFVLRHVPPSTADLYTYLAHVVNSEGHADVESFDEAFEHGAIIREKIKAYMGVENERLCLTEAGHRMYYLARAGALLLERWDMGQDMDTKAGEAMFELLRRAMEYTR